MTGRMPQVKIFLVLGSLLLLAFIVAVRVVILPFSLGLLLAYLLNPLVCFLTKKGFRREGAVSFLTVLLLLSGVAFFLIALPSIVERFDGLARGFPALFQQLEELLTRMERGLERFFFTPRTRTFVTALTAEIEETFLRFLERSLQGMVATFSQMLSLVLAPILAFYFLRDWEEIGRGAMASIPPAARGSVTRFVGDLDRILGGFLRGQLIASAAVAFLSILGLLLLKLDSPVILGLFAGITNLIPYFGPVLGAVPPLLIALGTSPLQALGVLILFVAIQQGESLFITPRIFSRTLGLHPLVVIFALLAGGYLMGFVGLLVAVPLAGIAAVTWKALKPYLGFPVEEY